MRKIKGLRWYMIALVTLGTVLGYLTRNTVAAAAPTLMEELHISTQQYSYIIAAYSAAYTVMQPVAGYVLDILGTKIGYAFFAIAWAVFCGSTALAGSWGGLALARGAVGAAEAAMIPAGLKASSEWFPAKERSIAVGYFNVGSSIGAMIAPPLVVWAIVMHSWQMAFIISGVLSFAWAIAWLIFYKHPRDQKKLSDEERDYIIGGQESQHQTNNAKKMSPWQILRNRQFWGIALPRFLAEPAWGTFNAWIPLFMFKVYGFNLKEIAMFAWMPMLFADLGCIVGGYLPPLFQRWFGVNLIVSRKMVVTMGGDGAVYADQEGYKGVYPALKVDVVDTTGAGDSFFAGVCMGLTYGKTLREACGIGTRLASTVICTSENICPRFMPEEFRLER